MSSDSFMVLFDFVIFFYGLYMIYSAYQMKRSGQPSNLIINPTELVGAKDMKGFCQAMYKPLILFGILAVAYGVVGYLNDKYWNYSIINFISVAVFLVLCVWFLRMVKKYKAKYIK